VQVAEPRVLSERDPLPSRRARSLPEAGLKPPDCVKRPKSNAAAEIRGGAGRFLQSPPGRLPMAWTSPQRAAAAASARHPGGRRRGGFLRRNPHHSEQPRLRALQHDFALDPGSAWITRRSARTPCSRRPCGGCFPWS
jgi:hypothetical protein